MIHTGPNDPAFPLVMEGISPNQTITFQGSAGMTMREWYATHAMNALLGRALGGCDYREAESRILNVAKFAFETADAMLAESRKEPS